MKDEDYLVHNLNKIAMNLEKLNWNLGKIAAKLLGDNKTIDKITKAENEKQE